MFSTSLPQVHPSTEDCNACLAQLNIQQVEPQRSSEITTPSTPFQTAITLPPVSATSPLPCGTHGRSDKELYPIQLLQKSSLSLSQTTDLLSIKMSSPIHVHTPSFHIGTLHLVHTTAIQVNEVTALDVTLQLQSISQMSLSIHTYLQLPEVLRNKVKQAYQQRVSSMSLTVSKEDVWDRFILGEDVERAAPFVGDLFMEIWGFELSIWESYSIVHVV